MKKQIEDCIEYNQVRIKVDELVNLPHAQNPLNANEIKRYQENKMRLRSMLRIIYEHTPFTVQVTLIPKRPGAKPLD
ncbi:MAG: hypothetical protein ACPGFK_00650 [Flavobacteriaceae bacterium]